MTPPLQLLATTPAHLPQILPLLEAFYQLFNYPYDAQAKQKTLEDLWAFPDRGRFWLLTQGETVVGYLYLSFYYSLEFGGRTAFIDELFILPDHRGKGLGSQAIALVEEASQPWGLKALHLESERTNDRATALYTQRGFVDYDRRLLTKILEV